MMPPIEEADQHDAAVLWPATGGYSVDGQPIVGSPVEVTCRWEQRAGSTADRFGNTIAYDAEVAVSVDAPVDSHMWRGKLTEHVVGAPGLMRVVSSASADDVRSRFTRRILKLAWLHA